MLPTHATAEKLEFAAVSMHTSRLGGRSASCSFGGAHFLRKPVNNRVHAGTTFRIKPTIFGESTVELLMMLLHLTFCGLAGASEHVP
jgi:hypothetical protein